MCILKNFKVLLIFCNVLEFSKIFFASLARHAGGLKAQEKYPDRILVVKSLEETHHESDET